MKRTALPQRVIAKHNQTTMFSTLLALQYQTSGSGARGGLYSTVLSTDDVVPPETSPKILPSSVPSLWGYSP